MLKEARRGMATAGVMMLLVDPRPHAARGRHVVRPPTLTRPTSGMSASRTCHTAKACGRSAGCSETRAQNAHKMARPRISLAALASRRGSTAILVLHVNARAVIALALVRSVLSCRHVVQCPSSAPPVDLL